MPEKPTVSGQDILRIVGLVGAALAIAAGSAGGATAIMPNHMSAVDTTAAAKACDEAMARRLDSERELTSARFAKSSDVVELGAKVEVLTERLDVLNTSIERLEELLRDHRVAKLK